MHTRLEPKSKLVLLVTCISIFGASPAFTGATNSTRIQFPNEKPAFSIEVPAGFKTKSSQGSLSIAINFETDMWISEVSADVHDDKTAREYLYREADKYLSQGQFYAGLDRVVETPKVPEAKEALPGKANITGFHIEAFIENQRRMGHLYDTLGYSAWIFTCCENRYFMVASHGNSLLLLDNEPIILKSIAPSK
jgi:hypothetical protein